MPSSVFINPHVLPSLPAKISPSSDAVTSFHQKLPSYAPTKLHNLTSLAQELGIGHVLLKDESTRFGTPSFKIAGASWAVYRAVAATVGLPLSPPPTLSLEELGKLAKEKDVKIFTCTAGNWGRAVARMATFMGLTARVYVPSNMYGGTVQNIESEGAEVRVEDGGYDGALRVAEGDAKKEGALLIVDYSWDGQPEVLAQVPSWVAEGYGTILRETDEQVSEILGAEGHVDAVVVPIGGGVLGHAVTAHHRAGETAKSTRVIAVEPETAASLRRSLEEGANTEIKTGDSIMYGMNTGLLSRDAWPILRDGVNISVTITDREDHEAVRYLSEQDIHAGPCGASGIAALRKVLAKSKEDLELQSRSVVVVYCTEGSREYRIPQ